MKKHALAIVALAGIFIAGCSSEPVEQAPVESTKVAPAPVANESVSNHRANMTESSPQNNHQAYMSESGNHTANHQMKSTKPVKKPYRQPQLIKISGIGYGAESTYEAYTPGQRRLMAIRASKLDAYRSLAEQIHGIKIDSNTSISTLTAKNDSFRARVNAIVRGARVVSVTPMADRNYETVLEVFVDRAFFNNAFVYTNCPHNDCGMAPIDPADLCNNGLNCQSIGSH